MIKSIQLENFKCFLNEPIDLTNLNLLTGLNGMGKSSVIQSLILLRQNYENGLLHLRNQLGLNGEYLQIGTSSDLLYRYFSQKYIAVKIVTTDDKSFSWQWSAEDNADILPQQSFSGSGLLEETALFGTDFHYLNAERIGPRPFYETSTTKVIHENQIGVKGEFAANYFAHKREQIIPVPEMKFGEGVGLTLYEQVNAWMSVIRPGTKIVVREQPDSGTVSLHYEFITGIDNPGGYKANNVGFGLTYIFPLIVAVLSSKPGTLLLLENPEAHIHPKGQAELGIFLAKAAAAGIQLIVETHSDHILNGVRYAVKSGIISNDIVKVMFFTGSISDNRFHHYIENVTLNKEGKIQKRPVDFFDTWDDMLVKLI